MAITRIKNNQITDSTVNAAAKLSDYSITSGKLANSLTYGSDLTISGNLTVNGTTTTVDTNNMTVDDPLLLLASNQTGSGAVDIGFIGERGDDTNVAFVFDESGDEFAVALTSTADANTTITITDYADLHAGGITADDAISATGNVTGGNLTTAGDVTTATVTASSTVTATGNVTGGNLTTAGDVTTATVTATGNIDGGNIISQADVTTSTVTASSTVTATGNVTGGNLTTGGLVSATGNVTGGNLTTAGDVTTATLTTSGAATVGGALTVTGNLTVNGTTTTVDSTVTTIADPIMTFGQNATDDNKDRGIEFKYNDGSAKVGFFGYDDSAGKFTALVGATNSSEVFSGTAADVDFGAGGFSSVTASGNVNGGNLVATSDVTTATVTASSTVTATGNVTGGNLTTAGDVTTASVTASGAITGASIDIAGQSDLDNIRVDNNDITAHTGGIVTFNDAGGDVDFRFEGDTDTNLLVLDAGSDSISIGTATQTAGAKLKIGSTDSMLLPVGNTAQRPGTGVTGMIRFNSQLDQLEFYDSNSWTTAGSEFTVIASETETGDGSTVAFTLSESQTTASCIVSINGVVQIPTTAYSVSGTTLTFTEAPLSGDVIEIRKLTTTSTVTALVSADTTGQVNVADSSTVTITGDCTFSADILPSGNASANIGSASNQFNTVFATATSAQYADLAEMYAADAEIEPGTVVVFGGDAEVTIATTENDSRVAGVVSTNPSYLMNSAIDAEHAVAVAFTGRVPTKVTGTVAKGDLMVSAGDGKAKANNNPAPGTIIGKALENSEGDATIEVVVGRF